MLLIDLIFNNNRDFKKYSHMSVIEDIEEVLNYYNNNSIDYAKKAKLTDKCGALVLELVVFIPIITLLLCLILLNIETVFSHLAAPILNSNSFLDLITNITGALMSYLIINALVVLIVIIFISIKKIREYFISVNFLKYIMEKDTQEIHTACNLMKKSDEY